MTLVYTSVDRVLSEEPKIGSATTILSAHLFQYATAAEAVIDATIVRNYELPVSSGVGHIPILTAVATDIAVYRTVRRIFLGDRLKDSEWPETFKEALELLTKIGENTLTLVDSGGNIVGARNDVAQMWSNTMGYHPTFTELPGTLEHIDEDKIEDLLDEREIGIPVERLT